jgi:hypothetical protein
MTRELASVIQADREAAEKLVYAQNGSLAAGWCASILAGRCDNQDEVQAFARHRLAHAKEQAAGVERRLLQDFVIALTDGGKNRRNTLSINHDRLAELVLEAQHALAAPASSVPDNAQLVEALERIVEVGTRKRTERVGDMYDLEGGYVDFEEVSEEAEIASQALAALSAANGEGER